MLAGWKMDNRLRRCAIAGNLNVFAPNGELRAGRLGPAFERAFAPDEMKRGRIARPFAGKIHRRLYRFVTGTHDAQVIFARLQIFESSRTLFGVSAQTHEPPARFG